MQLQTTIKEFQKLTEFSNICQQDAVNYITHFLYKANYIVIKGALTKHFHHSRNIEVKYGFIS